MASSSVALDANGNGTVTTTFDIPSATVTTWFRGSMTDVTQPGAGALQLDAMTINASAVGFVGAVFDGRFLYLVPTRGVVARFDAKTPPSLPVGYAHGSFL